MKNTSKKLASRNLRKTRIRSRLSGTTERPRLSVTVSNIHITAQLIDDEKHKTIAYASTVGKSSKITGSLTEKAKYVGGDIAKKAKAAKITKVVFDRNGRIYHGRIKALADAARAEGLEF